MTAMPYGTNCRIVAETLRDRFGGQCSQTELRRAVLAKGMADSSWQKAISSLMVSGHIVRDARLVLHLDKPYVPSEDVRNNWTQMRHFLRLAILDSIGHDPLSTSELLAEFPERKNMVKSVLLDLQTSGIIRQAVVDDSPVWVIA